MQTEARQWLSKQPNASSGHPRSLWQRGCLVGFKNSLGSGVLNSVVEQTKSVTTFTILGARQISGVQRPGSCAFLFDKYY